MFAVCGGCIPDDKFSFWEQFSRAVQLGLLAQFNRGLHGNLGSNVVGSSLAAAASFVGSPSLVGSPNVGRRS